MSDRAFVCRMWRFWVGGVILFSAMCILMGLKARPRTTAFYCIAMGTLLIVSSPLPFRSSLPLIFVPVTGGWSCSVFRHGHFEPFQFLGGSLALLLGVVAAYSESWIPTVVLAGGVFVAVRVAPHLSRRALLVASALPTVAAVLLLLDGRLDDMPSRGGPTEWIDIACAIATLAIAIGGSMLWEKWRAARAARNK